MSIFDTTFFTRIRGFKTIATNGVVMLLGLGTMVGVAPAALTFGGIAETAELAIGGAEMIFGAINIMLRMVTKTPVLKGE